MNTVRKSVLILGANSDVAKQCILQYIQQGYAIMAASRDLESMAHFVSQHKLDSSLIDLLYFDAADFASHETFYHSLPSQPAVVLYAAGFLVQNSRAMADFPATFNMMKVNYIGAVSILTIIAGDVSNHNLERIVGLSSLSGVRGRKSNFIYGSTKSAFTQYLAGLRQWLAPRNIKVNVVISGYINTKINTGLKLNQSLMMEPDFVAQHIVEARNAFEIVPGWKWKIILRILKFAPEFLVAKLP